MYYEGKIYRPWMEANSLLIQTTLGCTHNKCTFCDMFREKRFRIRKIEEIFKDIDRARQTFPHIRSIFLIDGNVLALKTGFLLKILDKVTETFPECAKIALYAGLNDLRRKSVEELKELKRAGLTLAYTGLESGDPVTLERIKKGLTPEQAEKGMARAKAAGIDLLASIIFGIGGRDRSREHIVETTRLLNVMKPEQIAPMALTIQPGTELAKQVESGEFIQATPLQILEEEKYLLENLSGFETIYRGDHANNIVSSKGILPESRELFIGKIDHAIANHPVTEHDVLMTSPW
ncbi:radical SAM protein [Desulfosarcina alkanivorans]|uniref:Radical SAM protein n=1 Tax=Desulfosarcina alkanivorans TaxID=571177 RepID=A0A5K7YSD8_9BACT|nr:radical SAM protein [Desulfosarcina alkanivorans]BBO72246.1 radical SAM protein [Desulfosarcina alkanivorans]